MKSRIETLLNAVINGETIDFTPRSRMEEYLKNCINKSGVEGLPDPRSRADALFYMLSESIASGGTGGGGGGEGGNTEPASQGVSIAKLDDATVYKVKMNTIQPPLVLIEFPETEFVSNGEVLQTYSACTYALEEWIGVDECKYVMCDSLPALSGSGSQYGMYDIYILKDTGVAYACSYDANGQLGWIPLSSLAMDPSYYSGTDKGYANETPKSPKVTVDVSADPYANFISPAYIWVFTNEYAIYEYYAYSSRGNSLSESYDGEYETSVILNAPAVLYSDFSFHMYTSGWGWDSYYTDLLLGLINRNAHKTLDASTIGSISNENSLKPLESLYSVFQDCANLTSLPYQYTTPKAIEANYMFSGSPITSVTLPDMSKCADMERMFDSCSELTYASISKIDSDVNMSCMFYNCSKLTTVVLHGTGSITDAGSMFAGCVKLVNNITLPDMSKCTSTYNMFGGCESLTSVPEMDTRNVWYIKQMFYGCSSLTTIPKLDLRSVTNPDYIKDMFTGCKELRNVTIKNIRVSFSTGTSTSAGQYIEVDSLVSIISECIDTGSTLTYYIGSHNISKLATVYVKLIDVTDEMREVDEFIDQKLPFAVCESTDEGAMLITDYILLKNWALR